MVPLDDERRNVVPSCLSSGKFKDTLWMLECFIIKSITRSLIIFKEPREMTNNFFNHYIFVHTFQWTSSECLASVTITVKVAIVT